MKSKSRHIQITCYPRSGSALLLLLMHGSVEDYAVALVELTVSKYMYRPGSTIGKRPNDILGVQRYDKYKDDGKVIYWIAIKRDIRSVITSYHCNMPDDYFIGYDYVYQLSSFKVGNKVNTGIRLMYGGMKFLEEMDNTVVIKYEDLVTRPDFVQNQISDDIDITFNKPFSKVEKCDVPKSLLIGGNSLPVEKKRMDKWKNHPERIKQEFTKFPELFNILIEDGYEKDREWFEEI